MVHTSSVVIFLKKKKTQILIAQFMMFFYIHVLQHKMKNERFVTTLEE